MTQTAFQLLQNKTHLEQVVEKLLSVGPTPRCTRPTTGWIPQRHASRKGCLVLWSQEGMAKYVQSGLLGWQVALAQADVKVREVEVVGEPVFIDRHQTVVLPSAVRELKSHDLAPFLMRHTKFPVRHRAGVYITRGQELSGELVLVCRGRSEERIEIPSVAFDLEEPQKEATIRCLKEQCGLEALIPFKVGIQYDYDPSRKEFLATHYYHGLLDKTVPEHWRHVQEDRRVEFSWCPVTRATRELPISQRAKLQELLS